MDNEIWPILFIATSTAVLGFFMGAGIAANSMKKQAIQHNVGYYNPTNGTDFVFVTLTNSPVTINK